MAKTASLTQARLKEVLHYDPETGLFTWAATRTKAVKGNLAGGIDGHGYWIIGIDGIRLEAVCKRKSAERQMNFHPNHGI